MTWLQMRKLTFGVIAIMTVLLLTAGAFTMATAAQNETDNNSEEMTEMNPEECQEMMDDGMIEECQGMMNDGMMEECQNMMGDGMMGENGMMSNGMMNDSEMGCH